MEWSHDTDNRQLIVSSKILKKKQPLEPFDSGNSSLASNNTWGKIKQKYSHDTYKCSTNKHVHVSTIYAIYFISILYVEASLLNLIMILIKYTCLHVVDRCIYDVFNCFNAFLIRTTQLVHVAVSAHVLARQDTVLRIRIQDIRPMLNITNHSPLCIRTVVDKDIVDIVDNYVVNIVDM